MTRNDLLDDDFASANAAIMGTKPNRAIVHDREREALKAFFSDDHQREDDNARAAVAFLAAKW